MNESWKLAARGLIAAMLAWAAAALAQPLQVSPSPGGLVTQLLRPLPATQRGQSATLLPDGRWLLIGGQGTAGMPTPLAFMVDPRAGQTHQLASYLHHARTGHSATLLPDGKVFVLGGAL